MPRLTDQGLQKINDLAQHYGVSADAVMTLLQALLNSKGTMAQFDHRELGGAGQWMPGGMTMVGDMFNHGLKAKVDGLCSELSQILAMQPFVPFPAGFQSQSQRQGGGQQEGGHDVLDTGSVSLFVPETPGRASGQWWPAELGFPNGTGAQNQVRYAYFNQKRRLAVELNGHVTVYDTLDHQISGVSQQQGRRGSLTLTRQRGTVCVSTLPAVSVDESGSMQGEKVLTAKALALALAWIARRQRRWCALVAYSGESGERLLALPPGRFGGGRANQSSGTTGGAC